MSVVNLVIHDSFALIMGDTKLSNNPHKDRISKVFKKDDILLGYTGQLNDVKEYLYPIFTEDMQLNHNYMWGNPDDPKEFLSYLDNKFYAAIDSNKEFDIVFAVAAKIGSKYIAKRYCLTNAKQLHWSSDLLISANDIRYFYLGEEVHSEYFKNLFATVSLHDLNDIVNIFQQTLDYGIHHDPTINNEMELFII